MLVNNSITSTSSPSLHFSLVCETSIIESNEGTVRDTYCSPEEKVNLLNVEVIAMKSFIEDRMLILRQSRKDSTLQKSPCGHYTQIAKLTEEIAYLRNKKQNQKLQYADTT